MSNSKFNENEINKMLKKASGGSQIDASSLKSAAQNGSLNEYIGKNLSPEVQKKVKSVLSDKKALEKLLSGKEAKELLKKFGKE